MTPSRLPPDGSPPDRYVVLGHPVAHSQSPFIHAAFAKQTGEAVDYGRLLCAPGGFEAAVRDFAAGGGRGCNVTVPFKFDAPRLAVHCSARALLAGAANVLRFDPGGWHADNTDGIGLVRDIQGNAGQPITGQRLLLVGAGGAGAGVLGPLLDCRPAALRVVNRSAGRAADLVRRHAALADCRGVVLSAGGLDDPRGRYDIVVNASASSLQAAPVPVQPDVLAPDALAMDLMYGAASEPFVAWAHKAGARPRDGLGMLVEQAAEAFHVWRGVRPETAPVLQALRQRLAAP